MNHKQQIREQFLKVIALIAKEEMYNETELNLLFDLIWEASEIANSTQV